jgi:hypothetical protein
VAWGSRAGSSDRAPSVVSEGASTSAQAHERLTRVRRGGVAIPSDRAVERLWRELVQLFERMKQIYQTRQAELSTTIWTTEAMLNHAERSGLEPGSGDFAGVLGWISPGRSNFRGMELRCTVSARLPNGGSVIDSFRLLAAAWWWGKGSALTTSG